MKTKLLQLLLLASFGVPPAFAQITFTNISTLYVAETYSVSDGLATPTNNAALPYSISLIAGALPPGLSLTATTIPDANGNPQGVIIGTPTAVGTFSFTLQAVDASAPPVTGTQAFTVTVAPFSITPSIIPGGVVGSSYGAFFGAPSASGGIAPYSWSVISGGLPPGIQLRKTTPQNDPATGLALTGALYSNPTAPGTYSFTLQVQDSSPTPLVATQTFTVSIATFKEYAANNQPPNVPSGPIAITPGPGSALWFTTNNPTLPDPTGALNVFGIGQINTAGQPAPLFPIPEVISGVVTTAIQAYGIVEGADGQLWFTDGASGYVGQMAPNGNVAFQYALPVITLNGSPEQLQASTVPQGITAGPDNAVWFAINAASGNSYGAIGRIATSADHTFTYYPISSNPSSAPSAIVTGPDGALWFTDTGVDQNNNTIGYMGRMTTNGVLSPPAGCTTNGTSECAVPGTIAPNSITVGPDGALWFTDSQSNQVGRITTDGKTVTLYSLPNHATPPSANETVMPAAIVAGSDGALWFTETIADSTAAVGRITTTGIVTEFATSSGTAQQGITSGPDGAIWFTEPGTNQIARIVPPLALNCNLSSSEQVGQPLPANTGCPALGGTKPYIYSLSTGTLPPGLTFDPISGAITGVPSAPGTYKFTVQATDNSSPQETASQQFTVTAAPRQPLVFSCTFPPNPRASLPYASACTTSGGIPPYAYAISSGGLPPGLALDPASGNVTGTPTVYGTYSFTVQASDSGTPVFTAVQQELGFQVLPPPLVLNCNFSGKAEVNIPYSAQCGATGGIPPYTFSQPLGTLPPGLSFGTTGVLSGTPSTAGASTFTVQVTDTGVPGQIPPQIVSSPETVTVIPPRLGLMCDFSAIGKVGVAYSTTCSHLNGSQPLTYSISAGTLPAGLTLNADTGKISGTPTKFGLSSFAVSIKDSESPPGTAIQVATLSVTSVQLAISTTTLPNGAAELPYSGNPLAQGGTSPYSWSVSAGTLPAGLSIDPKSGAITGTPAASGSYSFTLQVSDSSAPVQKATQAFTGTITDAVVATFNEYTLPANSGPDGITSGPDGALWFSTLNQPAGNLIGQITTPGAVTTYPAPNALSNKAQGLGITSGPDGTLWFAEQTADRLGQITTDGSLSIDYPVTTAVAGPRHVTPGPDGALWFTETHASQIGRISPVGVVLDEYPTTSAGASPTGIVVGPDNALWFTEPATNKIGQITTKGELVEHSVPTSGAVPSTISIGPDNALWFTENGASRIGRITISGTVTEFSTPTPLSGPGGIFAGPDGALYFTESLTNQIGRITTDGAIIEYPIPTAASGPQGITLGSDGALWFTETATNKIARLSFVTQLTISCNFPAGPLQAGATYSSTCTAANGLPPYTFSPTGTLPSGLSLDPSSGAITGTLSSPGTFNFAVQVTDTSSPAQTAVQQAPALVVTPGALVLSCSLPGTGVVGTAYSGTCSASEGTAPYTYSVSTGTLPPGLSLDPAAGTVTGTPTSPGSFPLTIQVVDSGTPAQVQSQSFTLVITFGSTTGSGGALFWLIGLPKSQAAGGNLSKFEVQLNQVSSLPITGQLTLGFSPYSGDGGLPSSGSYMDPALQFLNSGGAKVGTSYNVTFPPGTTQATVPGIDPGTVAGNINVSLSAEGVSQSTAQVTVPAVAPVIETGSVQIVNVTSSGFDVEFVATSPDREATVATFTFSPASGASIAGLNSFSVDVSSVLAAWFASDSGLNYGGAFSLAVPFNLSGPASAIDSVSVTLANAFGTSPAVSGKQ